MNLRLKFSPDPNHPPFLAPSSKEWLSMSPEEQQAKERELTKSLDQWEEEQGLMGSNTEHQEENSNQFLKLKQHFRNSKRECFIASDLYTLYPNTPPFYPDLMVVFDVKDKKRSSYNVATEGKKLDFVLEIVSPSNRDKDYENIEFYASLGIPEYFILDLDQMGSSKEQLLGFCLKDKRYQKIEEQELGIFSSELNLFFRLENKSLKIYDNKGRSIWSFEEFVKGYHKEKIRADWETKRAEQEKERANLAEAEVKAERKAKEEERKAKEEAQDQLAQLRKAGIDVDAILSKK